MKRIIIGLLIAVFLASPAAAAGTPLRPGEQLPRRPAMGDLLIVIQDTVRDSSRQEPLLRLGREVDAAETALAMRVAEYAVRLRDLNADYGATRDQFDDLDLEYGSKINWQRKRLAEKLIAMRALVTADEWKKIGGPLAAGLPDGYGLGGGDHLVRFAQQVRKRVPGVINDRARERRIFAQLDVIERELTGYARRMTSSSVALSAMVTGDDLTREGFEKQISLLEIDWTGALTQSVEARFRMRQDVDPGEWKRIFAVP